MRRFLSFLPLFVAATTAVTALQAGEVIASKAPAQVTASKGTDEALLKEFLAPELAFRYDYDFPMSLENAAGEYSMHEFRASVPLPPVMTDTFILLAKLNYRLFLADVDTSVLHEDLDLHTLRLPIQAAWLSPTSPWLAAAYVEPGISSDFNRINSDAFDLSAGFGIGYRFSPNFMAAVGAGYSRNYGDDDVFPVLALLWRVSDRFTVTFSPDGLIPSYKVSDDLYIKLRAELIGGRWLIEDEEGRGRILRLQGASATLQAEQRLFKDCWLTLGVGINAFSELRIEDSNKRELLDEDLEDGVVIRTGLKWVF
ncbi:DUF6268 family outer membrane beta-barrel protein [Roseimicrobium sp. ORNL1]|uniref:DUF6268 family outer membrane beta-barrel protein n=1 Tax=Roseimicrobium sp. ORNL1 TaxID=2711231 RepID=UPI0013E11CA6|nr:DUF6268 family outer membrane beta-barrel protein [Roseimicrobium sp. ORNL1]QIF00206.1 porin family protein [Roseimicrobium sp. ORNL1]